MNPREDAQLGQVSDLLIDEVIKRHPALGGAQVLTIRSCADKKDPNHTPRYLVFADVVDGRVEVYRGHELKSAAMLDYLRNVIPVPPHDLCTVLAQAFDHLDHPDTDLANEAWAEFRKVDFFDSGRHDHVFRKITIHLRAEKLVSILRDPQTPHYRLGGCAILLGHCGTGAHAELLRAVLQDRARYRESGEDGLLIGLTMLDPTAGADVLRRILGDRLRDFMQRYAALRAVRFLVTCEPGIMPKQELVQLLRPILDQGDIADLLIEDLRKWRYGEWTDRIVALYDKKSHDSKINRWAILRYALTYPDHTAAAALVARLRRDDLQFVQEQEDLLGRERNAKPEAQ